jgi:Terpene synthase family 2, C-terminal metal binding
MRGLNQHIAVPEFYFPFESGINPYLTEIQAGSLLWMREIGCAAKNSCAYDRSKAESHAVLVAYALPQLPLGDLQLAADAMTWFFIHDDYMDAVFHGSPGELQDLHSQLLHACNLTRLNEPAELLSRGLHDICRRIYARSGASWLQHFTCRVREFLQSVKWEHDLRQRGETPDLATYMLLRPVVGTIYMVFSLAAMLNDVPAEAEFLRHLYIRKLTDLAGLQMTFYNDVWSFERDLEEGNRSNLIFILQNENSLDLQAAVNLAVTMTNNHVTAFLRLAEMLPCFGPEEDGLAKRYVIALENFMNGQRNWMMCTPRFRLA